MRSAETVFCAATLTLLIAGGCASAEERPSPTLRYVGSSTIAHFIRDVAPVYDRACFHIDTEPESAGGEQAILEGRSDLSGVAGVPREETLKQGVEATLLGRDAIAVIVHPSNPVESLSLQELKAIFTGQATEWTLFGGPAGSIRPHIVGSASATRYVFRSAVLGAAAYSGCEVVRPDEGIVAAISVDPGAIGQISLSFLRDESRVKVVAVDGRWPEHSHPEYPITRPLYLLSWPGRARVAEFMAWTHTPEAQAVLKRRFVRAVGPDLAEGAR